MKKWSIMFEAQQIHEVEQMTFTLVNLLGKQQVIMMVIWMSQEFDEAYLGAQQILHEGKNRGNSD